MAKNFPTIDFTNFRDHPESHQHHVYHFYRAEQADYFQSLLELNEIWFERLNETEKSRPIFYFGIKKTDYPKVKKLNNLAIGKYRKPFIPDRKLGYFMIAISLLVIILAFLGYFLSER